MGMEFDRKNKEVPKSDAPAKTDGQGGKDGGGEKPASLSDVSGPKIDRDEMRKEIGDKAAGSRGVEGQKEAKDSGQSTTDRATEQQRNRDLWKQ